MFSTLLLTGALATGQSAPEFDVASIKPAPLQEIGRTSVRMSSDTDAGTLAYSNVNLRDVLARAYNVQPTRVKGPAWIESQRFDIAAKFAPETSRADLARMLQALLAERFALRVHREDLETSLYRIVLAKDGPKFSAVAAETGISSSSNGSQWRIDAKLPMTRFAEFLSDRADRPVVDGTGLAGVYALKLEWAEDNTATLTEQSLPSLFVALQEQLGLRLELAKGPLPQIVVDGGNSQPSDN